MTERTIWSNNLDPKDWEEDYKCWLEDGGYTEEDAPMSLVEWMYDTNNIYLDDERANLNKDVDGVIIAYADLGLWYGRVKGIKRIGTNVSDILYSDCDYVDWYCDRYNVRCRATHHDGRNHYLYRVAKDEDTAQRIIDKMCADGMTEEQFRKRTKSLRPYVARTYGW